MPRSRQARRCSARNRFGEPCGNFAIVGGAVCTHHGGSAPQVREAANRRVQEARAMRALGALTDSSEVEPITNPVLALAELAGEVVELKRLTAQLVARLETVRTEDGTDVAPEVRLYERALDRAERVLSAAQRLGLQEQMVKLSQEQGAIVARILHFLADMMLDRVAPELSPATLDALRAEVPSIGRRAIELGSGRASGST